MNDIRIRGADAGDFVGGKLIWSALNALRPAKQHAPTLVDLSDVQLLRPYSLATIAALGCLGMGRAELCMPRTALARAYVVRSGLATFFRCEDAGALSPSERTVPVRQLTVPDVGFTDEITHAWAREFAGMSAGLRPRLADHLDEMVRNALAHAASPIGCLVAAQVYPATQSVEVAILDLGQTIRGHLSKQPEHRDLRTDDEAIQRATEEGVTGTPAGELNALGEVNSGIGLYELRQYCESGGGELAVVSGFSYVVFRSVSAPLVSHFAGGFPGCLVNIRFRV